MTKLLQVSFNGGEIGLTIVAVETGAIQQSNMLTRSGQDCGSRLSCFFFHSQFAKYVHLRALQKVCVYVYYIICRLEFLSKSMNKLIVI